MTVIIDRIIPEDPEDASVAATAADPDAVRAAHRGLLFWIRRYLPAEAACTVLMLIAGLAASQAGAAPAIVAAVAWVGETVGFYAVLAATIYLEQSRVVHGRRRAATRTGLLLFAEFGAAELVDSLLVRPAALFAGVLWMPDAAWGLLAGKLVADVIFYAVAAGAFTITARTGVRAPRATREPS